MLIGYDTILHTGILYSLSITGLHAFFDLLEAEPRKFMRQHYPRESPCP